MPALYWRTGSGAGPVEKSSTSLLNTCNFVLVEILLPCPAQGDQQSAVAINY